MEKSFWDRAASVYDLQSFMERTAQRRALQLANIKPGDRVLDIATGTGAMLKLMMDMPDRPEKVLGIDLSPKMLEQVPRLPSSWMLVEADAQHVPSDDDSIDVIFMAYLLHFIDDEARDAVLAEARRVLAPGGRLITITPDLVSNRVWGPVGRFWNRMAERGAPPIVRQVDAAQILEARQFEVIDSVHVWQRYASRVVASRPAEIKQVEA